jgi:ribosomal protein L37AE/L43A
MMTTASIYRQRQDIIQGMHCPNCGQIRWAREGDDGVHCQECDSVFKVRALWAEMSDLPVTQPAELEVHLDHADFASLVIEYALLDRAERVDGANTPTLIDRGQRLQRLEDILPADVCAAIQLLNERAAREDMATASELPNLSVQ